MQKRFFFVGSAQGEREHANSFTRPPLRNAAERGGRRLAASSDDGDLAAPPGGVSQSVPMAYLDAKYLVQMAAAPNDEQPTVDRGLGQKTARARRRQACRGQNVRYIPAVWHGQRQGMSDHCRNMFLSFRRVVVS